MRVSPKLVVLLVCALIGSVHAAAKATKEANVTPKDTNAPPVLMKKAETAKDANAPPVEPNAPKRVDPNEVAVTVNGTNITEGDIDAKIKPYLERISKQMPPNVIDQYKGQIRNQALESMIVQQLMDEKVKKADITVTDKDVNDKIAEIASQQNIPLDSFKSLVQAQGQDYDQFIQQMKKGLTYEKLIDRDAKGALEVNDAEAQVYYEENKEDYNTPEQVQASHILIKPDPNIPDANQAKAKAKEKAEALLKQIRDGGDFAALAKDNSDCPSKAKGGDLGFFPRGAMVKPFEDVAFTMQPGQVSDVVETQFGYHIIKVTDRKPAGLTPFDKAKDDIIKTIKARKEGQVYRQYVEKMKAEAKIVYPPGKEPPQLAPRQMEIAPQRKAETPPAPK